MKSNSISSKDSKKLKELTQEMVNEYDEIKPGADLKKITEKVNASNLFLKQMKEKLKNKK